jgi:hypothetical protein
MAWVSVQQRLPRTFTRVWVITDTGQQTTAYVKSDGEWFINCPAYGHRRRCAAMEG